VTITVVQANSFPTRVLGSDVGGPNSQWQEK